MKRCISTILRIFRRIKFLWRTSNEYVCKKCVHYTSDSLDYCQDCKITQWEEEDAVVVKPVVKFTNFDGHREEV